MANKSKFCVFDSPDVKVVRSEAYNYNFDKKTGVHQRWGKTTKDEDDPQFCPVGPELLDIEISINNCKNACPWCYKSNTSGPGKNMTLDTFKKIAALVPKTVCQIAFGITGTQANPDFIPIMKHCREVGIIPNYTLSGIDLTDEIYEESCKLVGAVAVSAYQGSKDVCYDTVARFSKKLSQTNIHLMICQETFEFAREVLKDRVSDPRLKDMNAIVFLSMKPKGRAKNGGFHPIGEAEYGELVSFCRAHKIGMGFDSCGSPRFEEWAKQNVSGKELAEMLAPAERCESCLFSLYVNVEGKAFPCSFCEGEGDWKEGIDLLSAENFTKDVWKHPRFVEWRKNLLAKGRECPVFKV